MRVLFIIISAFAVVWYSLAMIGVEGLFFILVLIASVVLHEMAHGYAAYSLGDPTPAYAGRLTINPIPHIDPIGSVLLPAVLLVTNSPFLFGWARPVPYNPANVRQGWGEAFIAFAGPGTNLLLAVAFAAVVRLAHAGALPEGIVPFALQAVIINVVLALFNLIPIPPLDGSKILSYFLPLRARLWYARLEANIASWGFFGLALLLFAIIALGGEVIARGVRWIVSFLVG